MTILERRRALMARKESALLPPEYQQVEWIGSNGTQYINPGLTVSDLKSDGWAFEITLQDNGQGTASGGVIANRENLGHWFGVYGKQINQINNVSTENPVTVSGYWDASGLTVQHGQNSKTTAYNNYQAAGIIAFFTIPYSNSTRYPASIKLFRLTVYKASVPVANFYPCYRKSDEKVGLYDVVREAFFADYNGGNFTKGANV